MLLGIFVVGVGVAASVYGGPAVARYLARRPGVALLTFGAGCLAAAMRSFAGTDEEPGPRWAQIFDLLTYRFLPGLILSAFGLAATGLGLLEVLAPQTFDEMGGRVLELLVSPDKFLR